ncbi:hypothetical protein [Methanoculleus sp.]|uniref:hypothetical protein n=1 Tax=Methanoculleus sp. TaxID=90427 RepID=UPI00262FEF96|nr:hypothetical protein [Methanoculleus sp.]MDI6866413.1 hypothetical protein [Methanoculleus sp.]
MSMNDKNKAIFGAVLGALYTGTGILQFACAFFGPVGGLEGFHISGDLFNGFVLLVIGAVLMTGAWKVSAGAMEGIPFICVGLFLSTVFGVVALCSIGAGVLEATFFAEGGETVCSAVNVINPLLYLAAVGVIGLLAWGREFFRGAGAS